MKFKLKQLQQYRSYLINQPYDLVKWGESIIIPLIFVGLGYLVNPNDPFALHGPFPWVFLAPALIALRYSTLLSVVSILVIIVGIYLHNPSSLLIYKYYLLGGIILTFICSEFSNAWQDKFNENKQLQQYLETKITQLTHAYYFTNLSNERLQQTLINKPITLQNAIVQLRKLLINSKEVLTPDIANYLLNLFEQMCSIEKAAIFIFKDNKFNVTPLAYLGEKFELNLEDDLIKNSCLQQHKTHYNAINKLTEFQHSDYIATNIIASGDEKILGILVIKEISFWSLNDATLQILNILSTYVADQIWAIESSKKFLKIFPSCPPAFATELNKLIHLKESANINSSIIAMVVPKDIKHDVILLEIKKHLTGLETYWQYTHGQHDIALILQPFTSAIDITEFLNNIQKKLKENLGITFKQDQIFAKFLLIYPADPEQIINWLLKYIHEDL